LNTVETRPGLKHALTDRGREKNNGDEDGEPKNTLRKCPTGETRWWKDDKKKGGEGN